MRAALLLLLLAGCGSSSVNAAIITTAIAATASGISRAQGGCYAGCPPGTVCNSATGFCELLPCRGLCEEGQQCDESGPVAKCVGKPSDIVITTEKEEGVPESQPPE